MSKLSNEDLLARMRSFAGEAFHLEEATAVFAEIGARLQAARHETLAAKRTVRRGIRQRWWAIEIDGSYFVKYRTKPMGRWTKSIALATPMPTRLAVRYARDWKDYDARKVAVAAPAP